MYLFCKHNIHLQEQLIELPQHLSAKNKFTLRKSFGSQAIRFQDSRRRCSPKVSPGDRNKFEFNNTVLTYLNKMIQLAKLIILQKRKLQKT